MLALGAALVVVSLFLLTTDADAQCAMCKMAAASSGASAQRALGIGSLVLLIPPVAIFCSFIVVVYRHRKAGEE
jgi:hypothetical protein